MIFFTVLAILVGAFEIMDLKSKGQRKDIAVYLGAVTVTLTLGYLYLSNPDRESIAGFLTGMIGFHL